MGTKPIEPALLVERSDSAMRLIMNRPEKGNALNAALVETLLESVEVANRTGMGLLVLQARGSSFSTGFDLSDIESESDASLAYRFIRIETLLQAIHHAPFETLALAHGRVFGAGADLVNACSRRFAAPGTTFRMPGLKFGVALGTRRFIRCTGETGRSILAENRSFDAAEALRINFIERVVDQAQWPRIVEEVIASLERLQKPGLRLLQEIAHPDQRDGDMGILARSVTRPGLKERILAYRDSVRQESKKKQ